MANFLLALVTAELSLFGVDAAAAPVAAAPAAAPSAATSPRFDSAPYRSALGGGTGQFPRRDAACSGRVPPGRAGRLRSASL